MDAYKSPVRKLNAFFQRSRDQWKQRSAEKQKIIRAQQTTIRDLERSRAKWKDRALLAEQQVSKLETLQRADQREAEGSSTF